MKKRTLALMLSAALCVGLLAGCGSSGDTTQTPAAGANSPAAVESEAPAGDNTQLSGIVNTKETDQEELLRLSAKYL